VNYLTDGATLLALIEEANYNYDNIRKVVQAKIDEAQKQIDELKAMSQEQFLAMISKSMFGVAMKEYYINRLEKRIENLKALPEHIDHLLQYWRTSRNGYFQDSIKYYKPYVRQLKQAFQKLAESRFNSKLSSFSMGEIMSLPAEVIPAKVWREQTTTTILNSIDIALSVLKTRGSPKNKLDAHLLASTLEDGQTLLRRYFEREDTL